MRERLRGFLAFLHERWDPLRQQVADGVRTRILPTLAMNRPWIGFSAILVFVFMAIASYPSVRAAWLSHRLCADSQSVAQAAEEAMIAAGGKSIFGECAAIIQFGTGRPRVRAVRVLGELGYPQARPVLRAVIDNPEEDEEIRLLAREALVKVDLAADHRNATHP